MFLLVEPLLQRVQDHAIGALDLAIGPWVCHRDIVDGDASFIVEIPEVTAGERGPKVGDDAIRQTKPVDDVIKQLGCFLCCSLD